MKTYAERYWEMFNKIDGDFDEVAIRTFKVGLPPEHSLRKSLTGKPITSLRQLMDQVDKYKRIEDCRSLWDHLDQLVREGKLKQLLHHSSGLRGRTNSGSEKEIPLRPLLGTINVIFATLGRTGSCPSRVMSVARLSFEDTNHEPKRARVEWPLIMGFSDEDKIRTIQPHDDALVITLRIGSYDVKRVMVDQGSAAEIMYPDLYKGLSLRAEDLMPYSSPLVSFEGKVIIPKG